MQEIIQNRAMPYAIFVGISLQCYFNVYYSRSVLQKFINYNKIKPEKKAILPMIFRLKEQIVKPQTPC